MKVYFLMIVISFAPQFGKDEDDESYVRLQSLAAQRKGGTIQGGQSQFSPKSYLVWNQQPAPICLVGLWNRAGTLCFMLHTSRSASANPASSTRVESGVGGCTLIQHETKCHFDGFWRPFSSIEFLSPQIFDFSSARN